MAIKQKTRANKAFAEIIESTLSSWVAQSWQWDCFPEFGALVTITGSGITHVGIVHAINTGSSDPSRAPIPYQKTEEQLLKEQPQIFSFLKTTFTVLPLGHLEKGAIRYQLPPHPPKIHAFVQSADAHLCKQFFAHQQYLHLMFSLSTQILYIDELLLALLKQQAALGLLNPERVTALIETIALLTGNDYRRLKLFLQRAQPIITRSTQLAKAP